MKALHLMRSCIFRAQALASRFFFGTDFNNSTATEAANQRARKSIERAAHVQFDQIFSTFPYPQHIFGYPTAFHYSFIP
jgi:hypothetical protein